jgi:hypothetical protein
MENITQTLELGMQELETLEAPDWWDTALGVVAGASVTSAAGYVSYIASAAIIAT